MRYILTKYETIKRTEKIEYSVDIPEKIRNKEKYADSQVAENKYQKLKIVDVIDSEILDDEVMGLKAV